MTCVQAGDVVLCGVGRPVRRRLLYCPTCRSGQRFVQRYGGLYYGDDLTCCGCGDAWSGGELMERPFRRAWRKEATVRAAKEWDQAMPAAQYRAYVAQDLAEHTAFVEEQRKLDEAEACPSA